MKFALKGFKDRTIGCSNSQTPLEIKGQWLTQGRQPICENCSYHTGENEDCCKKHFGGENVVPFEIKLTSGQD